MKRSVSLTLPGELRHDDGGGIVCGVAGSVIDTDIGNGDADRGVRAPEDVDGIASNAVAVVLKDLRGIAYMLVEYRPNLCSAQHSPELFDLCH